MRLDSCGTSLPSGSYLAAQTDYIALCHWNANVDNAWFWRDAGHVLHCGLLDWGCVGQMNVAMALWGAMSGAETDIWDRHLDELLRLFVSEIHACGGPELSVGELHHQLMLYVGIMAIAWLLDVPALIGSRFGDSAHSLSRDDPLIKDDESVRAPLQMLTNALNLWETQRLRRSSRCRTRLSLPTTATTGSRSAPRARCR